MHGVVFQHIRDLLFQSRDVGLNGSPDKNGINAKIAVRQRISHRIGCLKLHVRVVFVKLAVQPQNVVGRFADNLNVPYDRVLKKRTCKKRRLVNAGRIGFNLGYRLKDMPKIILYS